MRKGERKRGMIFLVTRGGPWIVGGTELIRKILIIVVPPPVFLSGSEKVRETKNDSV